MPVATIAGASLPCPRPLHLPVLYTWGVRNGSGIVNDFCEGESAPRGVDRISAGRLGKPDILMGP